MGWTEFIFVCLFLVEFFCCNFATVNAAEIGHRGQYSFKVVSRFSALRYFPTLDSLEALKAQFTRDWEKAKEESKGKAGILQFVKVLGENIFYVLLMGAAVLAFPVKLNVLLQSGDPECCYDPTIECTDQMFAAATSGFTYCRGAFVSDRYVFQQKDSDVVGWTFGEWLRLFSLLNNLRTMAEPRQSPFELIDTIFKEPTNILAPTASMMDVQQVRKAFAKMVLYNDKSNTWYRRVYARLWFWTLSDSTINNILLQCDFNCQKKQIEEHAKEKRKEREGWWCCGKGSWLG